MGTPLPAFANAVCEHFFCGYYEGKYSDVAAGLPCIFNRRQDRFIALAEDISLKAGNKKTPGNLAPGVFRVSEVAP
jgi:hypothetical protein